MVQALSHVADCLDARFKIFHELMQRKIRNILLVSTFYDACLMEEDGRLAERITHQYRGLSLSEPPRLTWASTAEQALNHLEKHDFDLVITMRRLAGMDAYAFGKKLKAMKPHLPVVLLTHRAPDPICACDQNLRTGINRTSIRTGNADLLVALIKSVEDQMNVDHVAQVRLAEPLVLKTDGKNARSVIPRAGFGRGATMI